MKVICVIALAVYVSGIPVIKDTATKGRVKTAINDYYVVDFSKALKNKDYSNITVRKDKCTRQ